MIYLVPWFHQDKKRCPVTKYVVLLSSWPSCDLHSWPGEINDFLDGVSPACFLSAWLNTPAGHGPKKWLSDVVSFLSFFSSNFPYSWWIWGRPSERVALGGHPCIHHMNHPPKKLRKPYNLSQRPACHSSGYVVYKCMHSPIPLKTQPWNHDTIFFRKIPQNYV